MKLEVTKSLFRALEREQVDYALVGALALAAHGIVRATEDVDLFISPDPENVERLKAALRSVFHDPAIDEISAADLAGDYPAVLYAPEGADFSIDLVARLGEAFSFRDIETETRDWEDVRIRVATPRMLYRMKRDTVRPKDRLDAEVLRERFNLEGE